MRTKQKLAIAAIAALTAGLACASWWSYTTVGTGTLGSASADALIVFGSPAEIDGSPSAMQTWRVNEAVAEFRRGAAPHIIFAGGAAGNKFVEADVMAREARSLGVPQSAIATERHSRTTVENLQGVSAIMQAHGWTSAELISSADHLPRIAVLARSLPFQWRLHTAPTPGRGRLSTAVAYMEEAPVTLILRTFGSSAEPIIHTAALVEHGLVFLPKWIVWKIRHHGAPYVPTNAPDDPPGTAAVESSPR
ncbi:YdcF family protein [Terriglobus aquaticus]|uniref:YdcF family protein n=1 Tax=Terriglobus aquaticus TaxID=940139 RepID=A0ABW9KHT9_9BACT|nr:YdcF family protein [Terriglobus aquaticus]